MSRSPTASPERVAWHDVAETFYAEHRQGEHVATVGPNGSGKSTLLLELAKARARRRAKDGRPARVTVFGTKPRDRTLAELGWPQVTKWPPKLGEEHVIVWPKIADPLTRAERHKAIFLPLMQRIYAEGGQTIVIDEAAYFEERPPAGMGLRGLMATYWREARSNDLTLMAGTQRPRHVTRSMWSESYWLFVFRPEDEDDLLRVAQLSGHKQLLREIVPELDDHEFLLVRRRGTRREVVISQVDTRRNKT